MVNPSRAYSTLQRHLPPYLLNNYLADIIDEKSGRLYAVTFNNLSPEDYEKCSPLHDEVTGHSIYGADEEKSRIYTDEGRYYTLKGVEQSIKEGVYHAVSMKFYGCLYEGRWYILKELTYFGEHMNEDQAKSMLLRSINDGSVLNNEIYLPLESHHPTGHPDAPKMPRSVQFLEFVGIPTLVAYIKQEEKENLCRAFTRFMNLDIFSPFTDRLRAARFEEYSRFIPLYPDEYIMIFPASREFLLIPSLVLDSQKKYRICYFFWHAGERKMYEWTYFTSPTYDFSFHYSSNIIEDLSQICHWDNTLYLNSSCTLDDEKFWNTYVMAKDEGGYMYLSEL